MSDRKKKNPGEAIRSFEEKLEKAGRNTEAFFMKLERKLDRTFQKVDKSLEQFDASLDEKVNKIDQYFENLDQKLDVIFETRGLKKHYAKRTGNGAMKDAQIRAVDGVDLQIVRGETLGIVGESGCGKSTIARMMIGLIPPTKGSVQLFGHDLSQLSKQEKKEIRRRTGIVFQDPYGSMDPRMTVAEIVGEPLRAHRLYKNRHEQLERVMKTLEVCGLGVDTLYQYPHQFSGGQRQRICIARALVSEPDVVVCDEAVSALDVSIQAQIINLLCDLKEKHNLTYIFISHDLDVVRFISDRIAVMYQGRIVELASKNELFHHPLHPYTLELLKSAPVFGRRMDETDEPEPIADITEETIPERGCKYCGRCTAATAVCEQEVPHLRKAAAGHWVACHQIAEFVEE